MHLGNGAITPECGIVALGAAAAGAAVAYGVARAAGTDSARARTAGALGAAVFAAQMFNVPVLPFSSVHLIGGVLLAWALGPTLGFLTMAAVLTLQAVTLGDGGLLALGANVVNMAALPAGAVALVQRAGLCRTPLRAACALGATAYLCTLGAAALITLEVAIGRSGADLDGWSQFAAQMLATHAMLGIAEAAATVAVVAALSLGTRRSAPRATAPGLQPLSLSPRGATAVVVASLAVTLLSLPTFGLASTLPDGYGAVVRQLHDSGRALGNLENAPLAGLSGTLQAWQQALSASGIVPELLLVLTATLAAAGTCWTVGRCCRLRAA